MTHDDLRRQYLREISPVELLPLQALRAKTAALPIVGVMQADPAVTSLLCWLIALTGARRVLEIGAFTGCTTLAMAAALPKGGTVVALEERAEWADIGRPFWQEANCLDRIDLRIGNAAESLSRLNAEELDRPFDLVFVDADKDAYEAYLNASLPLVRSGGVLVFDNILFGGRVVSGDAGLEGPAFLRDLHRRYAEGLRRFNSRIVRDPRVEIVVLPISDVVTLARKKPGADVPVTEGARA